MILPHGGKLVDKRLSEREKEEINKDLDKFESLLLDLEQIKEVKNIARGVYSPLEGFLKKADFQRVVSEMRLTDGTVFSIPIVLDLSEENQKRLEGKKTILLVNRENFPVALLKDIEIFRYDKEFFVQNVFGTSDRNHPGVKEVYEMGPYLIGGEVLLLDDSKDFFPEHNFSPRETRDIFRQRGWDKVVAFQTRNVPHIGHEFLQKRALEEVDGLFINPVIGRKKIEDFKDEYIIASYEILIDKYYPKDKVVLGILPFKMRYAGPREAVFHALVRKNFGCSHFIVGRDHAGVGDYYGPFDAQNIFDNFKKEDIGIDILKYPEVVYYPVKGRHGFLNEYPGEEKISFSGTKLREKIKNKEQPPDYIIRPEVYNFLTNSYNSLVDTMYNQTNHKNQKGFVIWFTGLSQAGKTSVGDKIYQILKDRQIKVERLDGDIVRQHLSKDLGFSKEDRNENIRRVGFVSKLLSRNGVGVIASFISPYEEARQRIREETNNFIEVFCNCPLEVCEKRDTKGLYQKAREGIIKNFTGISDPYEKPKNPEIELFTDKESIEKCTNKIIEYLKKHNLI
jgi:sulfate adenylyltransferase